MWKSSENIIYDDVGKEKQKKKKKDLRAAQDNHKNKICERLKQVRKLKFAYSSNTQYHTPVPNANRFDITGTMIHHVCEDKFDFENPNGFWPEIIFHLFINF